MAEIIALYYPFKPQEVDFNPEKLTDYLKSVDAQMPTDKLTGETVELPNMAIVQK